MERKANHRIWERTTFEPGTSGQMFPKKHCHTELATGMHYLQNGRCAEPTEEIDILPKGGGASPNRQMQVFFPSDINVILRTYREP